VFMISKESWADILFCYHNLSMASPLVNFLVQMLKLIRKCLITGITSDATCFLSGIAVSILSTTQESGALF